MEYTKELEELSKRYSDINTEYEKKIKDMNKDTAEIYEEILKDKYFTYTDKDEVSYLYITDVSANYQTEIIINGTFFGDSWILGFDGSSISINTTSIITKLTEITKEEFDSKLNDLIKKLTDDRLQK